MKKVLLGLVIAVMMTGSGYSIPIVKVLGTKDFQAFVITNVCIDNYKFVISHRKEIIDRYTMDMDGGFGVSATSNIAQHFSIQDGKSLPTQC